MLSGSVDSAAGPVAGGQITLYLAGDTGPHTGATLLGHATTDSAGSFHVQYARPSSGIVYAVAIGGRTGGHSANSAIGLMGIAGSNGDYAKALTINEFTTVADEFALAQFADPLGTGVGAAATNRVGIENAVRLALTNMATTAGMPAAFWPLASQCTGARSEPDNCDGLERLNALANALSLCTTSESSSDCKELFNLTRRAGTTLAAIHAIVLNPSRNVAKLFALSKRHHTYSPALGTPPAAWFVALKYVGNGHEFDGPGAIAFDVAGNAWAGNNYTFQADHSIPTCGGKEVIELTPVGNDAKGAPFSGGGVDGVGWGTAFDANHNVWVGNFGFFGKGCTHKPAANSVSEFDPSGHWLSPGGTGFTEGTIDAPQATTFDQDNNLWIANYGTTTITEYPNGDPSKARLLQHTGVNRPFSIAIDAHKDVWVTSFANDAVVAIGQNGRPLPGSPYTAGGIKHPLGNAFDSRGNLWVSDSTASTVSALDASGTPLAGSPFTGGGVKLPWGIAVDGNDNVWVADFSGARPRLSELCGIRHAGCAQTGAPISPPHGFASKLLQRLTGVSIDASGNVWVCNNWLPIPVQTNPGGDALVEFVGIGGPVKTPMLGLPKQP
jgi:sugar lactone lactonase YvrE